MKTLEAVTELSAAIQKKAVVAVHYLKRNIAESEAEFLWNELFFRDDNSIY